MRRTGKHGLRGAAAIIGLTTFLVATVLSFIVAPVHHASAAPTGGNDDLRTGWYSDQPGLAPAQVSRPDFGQLFDSPVTGHVYAQPIVSNNTLLVATEENWIYGLDPVTGAPRWGRQLPHVPFDVQGELSCGDLVPHIGVTGTPVVDPSGNGTMYFFSKGYVSGNSGTVGYWLHGVDVQSGNDVFSPVLIQGVADNDASATFNARIELQRPALLLQNGVVYAGFGAHCDIGAYKGWVVGVSTSTHAITTMWTSDANSPNAGNGIWQSGSGIMSDQAGRMYVATGNIVGGSNPPDLPGPTAGVNPPGSCSQCFVRLDVQGNGKLAAKDFFRPYDAFNLDVNDIDFGSGGPVELPASMGTPNHPKVIVGVGKQGYVYLLDANGMGGYKMSGGGDNVIARVGPDGGVWSKPSVWPGDGGWVYIPTASASGDAAGSSGHLHAYRVSADGNNNPTIGLATPDAGAESFGFGSSAPVVTSDGTTSGSALVWIVWMGSGNGVGAQLRAYDAVPVNGKMNLRFSAPVGTATKFTPPGIANGRVYVGTRDGAVRGFGIPSSAPLGAPSVAFGANVVGSSTTKTATITANSTVTVQSTGIVGGPFTSGTSSVALPHTFNANETFTVPVTFSPTAVGIVGGILRLTTNLGNVDIGLNGTGSSATGLLTATPPSVSFGGVAVGNTSATVITVNNVGATALTITGVTAPTGPFALAGAPGAGTVIPALQSVSVTVSFKPVALGDFASSFVIDSTGGTVSVPLTGAAAAPGVLLVSSAAVDAGVAIAGTHGVATFFVSNVGGLPLTITKSKPPVGGVFSAVSDLPEGSVLAAGESRQLTIDFLPPSTGTFNDVWVLNGDGNSTLTNVGLTGRGIDSVPAGLGLLQALPPARLIDTRATSIVPAGTAVTVAVAGHGGVPASATGALLNVTVTGTSGPGYLTAYPCGQPVPLASNVNFAAGQTAANLAAVQIGAGGAVCVYASTTAHVIVDADGYFSGNAGSYVDAVVPARLLDTRPGAIAGPGLVMVKVAGAGGVPTAATSAVLNVTVTQTSGAGYASVYPCGQPVPGSSNVNWSGPGQTAANLATVGIGASGNVCMFLSAPSHVVVDVDGYLASTPGDASVALSPSRLHDSRPGNALAGGTTRSIPVAGLGGAGADASGAFVNVTVTEPTAPGFLTAFPCGQALPPSSNVNYGPGRTVANLVLVGLGSGAVCLYSSATTQVVVDTNGWTHGA